MNHFEEPNRKPRKKVLNNKKDKKTQYLSEEQYLQNKQKKQYKHKKNELRAQELWDDWDPDTDPGSEMLY